MQTDSWWQLRAGRDMWALEERVADRCLFAHGVRHVLVDHEWLAEVVFYALVKARWPALTDAVCNRVDPGRLAHLLESRERSSCERFGWVALALMPASVWWEPRPHAFSLLFIMVTVARSSPDSVSGGCRSMFLVWANCHGGVLLGFVLLGAGLGVQTLLAPRRSPARSSSFSPA